MMTCNVCHSQDFTLSQGRIRDWEFGVEGEYAYQVCNGCGVNMLQPFPTISDLVKAYPDHYPAFVESSKKRGIIYNLLFEMNNMLLRSRLKKMCPNAKRVLDVGCGNGELLLQMKGIGAKELYGIDFNQTAVRICAEKGIKMFHGVFLDYECEEASFDAIIMNNYIEHVLSPVDELKKAARLLRGGGILFGELPNFNSLDRMLFGKYWGGNHVPRHTYQYSPASLNFCLKEAGFTKVKIYQEVNPGHLALSIQNFFQRKVKDLKNNGSLNSGRASYFSILLLILAPINGLFAFLGKSGTMRFVALK